MNTASYARISQQAVAEAAGVSRPVVSVVLSGQTTSIGVSTSTRQRVLDAAQKLGYKPRFAPTNAWGRSKTRTILWIGDHNFSNQSNDDWLHSASSIYCQRLLQSVVNSLETHQYVLTFKQMGSPKVLLNWIAESGAEGVIWRADMAEQRLLALVAKQLPVVVINKMSQCDVDVARVNQDENARIALEHLYEHGHRRIAYYGSANPLIARRALAYQQFMAERGLSASKEFLALPDTSDVDHVIKANLLLDTWAQLGDLRPTALIANDVFILSLIVEAQRRGIQLPRELSLVGIDNIIASRISTPALTSMEQPLEAMGKTAVEMLLQRIEDPTRPTHTTEIHPSLVIRNSVANIAN